MEDQFLYLCYFGDGPLWDNTILLPAFPDGYSYFRPFRYRDKYIASDLLSQISDQDRQKDLIGEKVIVAMRFINPTFKDKILPIREAEITGISSIPGNYSIFFRLGALYNYHPHDSAEEALHDIGAINTESTSSDALFFEGANTISETSFITEDEDTLTWTAYCDAISKSTILPINKEAKQSIFLKFDRPSNSKKTPVIKIHDSERMGKFYGAGLREGRNYELTFYHRVPFLFGSNQTMGVTPFEIHVSSGNIELSKTEEDFTANYQTHLLTFSALMKSGAWEQVLLKPSSASISTALGPISTVKLPIQFKIRKNMWYRFTSAGIWVLFLAILLIASNILDTFFSDTSDVILLSIKVLLSVVTAIVIMATRKIL